VTMTRSVDVSLVAVALSVFAALFGVPSSVSVGLVSLFRFLSLAAAGVAGVRGTGIEGWSWSIVRSIRTGGGSEACC
jgi:hypothetical protein